jgi:NADH-quinone oxidoreductase subunit J
MLLEAEFLSIALVLVYVGAVMVLFLFVVMMLDVNIDSIRIGFWKHFPLAATMGAVIALELAAVLLGGFRVAVPHTPQIPAMVAPLAVDAASSAVAVGHMVVTEVSNTKALGVLLYTEYLYPVQVAALILLVALIAAIALTLRERKDTKAQNPADQVRVKARDRVSLVKMESVKPDVGPATEPEKSA